MGVKILKRYSSHSFQPIWTKLHNKYFGDREILGNGYYIPDDLSIINLGTLIFFVT